MKMPNLISTFEQERTKDSAKDFLEFFSEDAIDDEVDG
jgi:hypothetical protein